MKNFWDILGLEPTRDVLAIKRAYAQAAKICHPEENAGGFLKLREAYQAALAYAEGPEASPAERREGHPPSQRNSREDNRGRCPEEEEADGREAGEEDGPPVPPPAPEDGGWCLPDEAEAEGGVNPYADGEAIRQFAVLYTGKQRKDANLWLGYFTSDAFLEAGWDSRFTALLLEKVTEVERQLPPNKEFLMWLCTAYQFSVREEVEVNEEALRVERRERRVELCQGADFDGMEAILRIAAKGPLPKRPGGGELAMLESFKDYRHLLRLAESGMWNGRAMEEYQSILNHYIPFYIKERCDPKANPDHQRHPAGLRLILHFLRRDGLPEELYRHTWRKLDLKSALMGRAKILYGPLRECVMERVPGIEGEKPENFLQLNRDHDAYRARIKANPEKEDAESAAFFAREDLQKALRSPRFVAEQLLTYTNWRREGMGEGLVRRMLEFYRENPDIPRAGEVVSGLEGDLRARVVERRNREDARAEAFPWYVRPTLRSRPLFRHWLNTAFFSARDPETGTMLLVYLDKNLPYQADWSRRFVEREDGSQPPRTVAMCMGEVEASFYPRHMEYRVHGKPVYRPCLPFEKVMEEGGEWFLFLLPLAAAPCDWFPSVAREILGRIGGVDVTEEERVFIARCLAGAVCCLPRKEYTNEPVPPEKVLPLTLFAESGEQLFGCSWYEGAGTLTLFEQTSLGKRIRKKCEVEPEKAEAEARRLLAEAVSPTSFQLPMREAPWNIYYTELSGPEQEWTPAEQPDPEGMSHSIENAAGILRVREEQKEAQRQEAEGVIKALLARFGKGELRRLELSWFEGKLVFCKEPAGYACFYFEDHGGYDIWYSMLSKPEVYRTVDSEDVVQVPFGMGMLPDYSVHETPASILRNLERVFAQLAAGRPQSQAVGGWLWDSHTNRENGRHKLLMAQQKLGGLPPRRGRNHPTRASFVFSRYPAQMEAETLEGERTRTEIRSGSYGMASAGLLQFMGRKLNRLRLTWNFKGPEGETYRRHLVLLREGDRVMLAWLQDDLGQADFCEAECSDAEEETFLGRLVPGTLVHKDLQTVRNCVDLLLDDIDCTGPVIRRYFLRVADRPAYGEVRSLLVGDGMEGAR